MMFKEKKLASLMTDQRNFRENMINIGIYLKRGKKIAIFRDLKILRESRGCERITYDERF